MYYHPQRTTYPNPTPRRPRGMFFAGVFMTLMGIIGLAGVCAYMAFGLYNKSNLEEMNTAIQGPVTLPAAPVSEAREDSAPPTDSPFKTIEVIRSVQPVAVKEEPAAEYVPVKTNSAEADIARASEETAPAQPARPAEVVKEAVQAPQPIVQERPAAEQSEAAAATDFDAGELVSAYNTIYPGQRIHPKYWDRPLSAGADEYTYGVVRREDGFQEVSASNGLPRGTLSDAVHIRIPSIDVDSEVSNLAILDLGDSKQYETPAHVVGRIPQTSNPGEDGQYVAVRPPGKSHPRRGQRIPKAA